MERVLSRREIIGASLSPPTCHYRRIVIADLVLSPRFLDAHSMEVSDVS